MIAVHILGGILVAFGLFWAAAVVSAVRTPGNGTSGSLGVVFMGIPLASILILVGLPLMIPGLFTATVPGMTLGIVGIVGVIASVALTALVSADGGLVAMLCFAGLGILGYLANATVLVLGLF